MGELNKFIWFEGWVGTHFRVVGSHPDIHDHILENQRQMDRIGESSNFRKTSSSKIQTKILLSTVRRFEKSESYYIRGFKIAVTHQVCSKVSQWSFIFMANSPSISFFQYTTRHTNVDDDEKRKKPDARQVTKQIRWSSNQEARFLSQVPMGMLNNFIWFKGWVGTLFLVFESHPDIHDHILENNPTRQESYDVPDSKKTKIMDTIWYPVQSDDRIRSLFTVSTSEWWWSFVDL